jgi:PAS domain S-box-containing protein
MPEPGWPGLFRAAFTQSRNPMVLVDERRYFVDVNRAFVRLLGYTRDELIGKPAASVIAGMPLLSPEEWTAQLAKKEFTGEVGLVRLDGTVVLHQWGATVEVVTGRRLVLVVAMTTSRWGSRFRRTPGPDDDAEGDLSERELEVVNHVAHGRSGPEIAEEMGIAHDTVRTHVRNAMTKVGARSRAQLVAKALGEGLLLR